MKTVQEIDAELAALDQIDNVLISKSPNPQDVVSEIDKQLALLDQADAAASQPGFLERVGSTIDAYTGAPTRAALGEIAQGNIFAAPGAFASQFGADPKTAPTGEEIAQVMGLSTQPLYQGGFQVPVEGAQGRVIQQPGGQPLMQTPSLPSPAGAAGLAIDIGADVSNFIPVAATAKLLGKGVAKGGQFALKGTTKALDIATNRRSTEIIEQTGKIIDNAADAVKRRFKPMVAEDFEKFSQIAVKNNIDPSILPESVEFGPQSTITTKAKTIAEGPGGESIQKRWQRAQEELSDALETKITKLSGGERLDDIEAGNMIFNAYNDGIKKFFDQDMITHDTIIKTSPGLNLTQDSLGAIKSKLRDMQRFAIGRARRGFGDQQAQAQQIIKDVETLQRSFDKQGNLSYKRAAEALRNIGEEAFKKGESKLPIDQKRLQELYFTIRDAMVETAGFAKGDEVATQLAMNNKIMSEFLGEKSKLVKIFTEGKSPEKILESLIDSGDSAKVEALKEILSPEDFQRFKGIVADRLVMRNSEKLPLYGSTLNKFSNKKIRNIVKATFQPDELQELTDLLELGDRVGTFRFNMSNTNRSERLGAEFFKELARSVADEATLEQLKSSARRRTAFEFTTGQMKEIAKAAKQSPQAGEKAMINIIEKTLPVPPLQSKTRAAIKFGQVQSVQRTNEELKKEQERRKRAVGQ